MYVSEKVIKLGDDFGAIFWKKAWGINNLVYFSKIGVFYKMLITIKLFDGNSSNCVHNSIKTSICIKKCNINWG